VICDGHGFRNAVLENIFGSCAGYALRKCKDIILLKIQELVRNISGLLCPVIYSTPRVFEGRCAGRCFARWEAGLRPRAVNVNWNDDGWNVNANRVDDENRWNAGNRVFSRNY
jgi:hypothetical protein